MGEIGEVVFQPARMTTLAQHPGILPVIAQASQMLKLIRPMCVSILRCLCGVAILLSLNQFTSSAQAGGSGLNTLVVINQNSSNSITVGNYFAERRNVPPENIVRISWPGGNISWDDTQFQTNLLQPLIAAISGRGLSNQVQYVALSMDIPYATVQSNFHNGTTSGLFYGLKTGAGLNAYMLTNSYAGSEAVFADAKPAAAEGGYSFLTTMITAGSLAQAKSLVDQGVNSDSTFPTAPAVLAKTSDPLRRIRYTAFDNAIFNTRLRGNYSVIRKNTDSMTGETNLLGYQTGLMTLSVPATVFAPGAMADSLTSYGGAIFGYNEQTSLLAFIHAGAAGSYGTVTEPTANAAKFPNPQNYFFQSRGFNLAECYYQSLDIPFQGLVVGEPLAAPFAVAASGGWEGIASDEIISGAKSFSVQFTATDTTRPLSRIELFVDGKFFQVLTNITPAAGNQISVRLGTQTIIQTVPPNATLATLAASLAATINSPTISNATRTAAQAFGDRVELRFTGGNRPLPPRNLRVTSGSATNQITADVPAFMTSIGTASARTTFLAARPSFLDSPAQGIKTLAVNGSVQAGTWLRLTVTKTNGAVVVVTYTNPTAGPSPGSVLSNLVTLINAEPNLAGSDGVVAEDFTIPSFGNPSANLIARSPGLTAAGVRASLTSSSMGTLPNTSVTLTDNLTDLQPRNHLYLTTGAPVLGSGIFLDTTSLADGSHELTAVAYEGSNVRTQTRVTIPVRVQNTPLTASLMLVDLAATNLVSGNYQIAVTANTNNISSITLYSTGGAMGAVSNQTSATFAISGATLGVGRHPFYALVRDTLGRRYRTTTRWVRFE